MAHDIFISHAAGPERSVQVANAIVHELENRGVRCWIAPRDMDPGQDYMGQLLDRVSESKVLVLVFTAEANSSPHVKREVGMAFESEVPILPFRVQDVEPTRELKYCIGQVHWLDAVTPPLAAHIHELADSVEKLLAGDDEERIEEIRKRKVSRKWWRAVVWTMQHGGAALGIAAVLILGVLGFVGWKMSKLIPDIPDREDGKSSVEKLLEESTRSILQDRRLRPDRSVDIDQVVAKAFVCSYGRCGVNRVGGLPDEVSKVYFGSSRDELDRYVDVAAERVAEGNRATSYPVHYYPVYASTGSVFIQIETNDGKRRDVKEVRLQATGSEYSPYGAFVRLKLEDGPSDMSDPGALLASRETDSGLPVYVGSPSGVQSLQYAFDEGGFFNMSADQRFQGRAQIFELSLPSGADMLRVQYELSNGKTTDTFRYALPSVAAMQEDDRKRVLIKNLSTIVACARVEGEMPAAADANASLDEVRRAQKAANMTRIMLDGALMQAGLRGYVVERTGITVCVPHWLNSGLAGVGNGGWAVVREMEFRTDSGTKMVAPVPAVGKHEEVKWRVEIPELTRQIYARIIFTDGSKSDEVRVPVGLVKIP